MSKDHDSRISDLYRQSSQETPPAHLDQAVMDRARQSVHRRVFAPFGNHWAAGGVLVGVVVLSVLLVLTVPQPPESHAPEEAAGVPSSDALPMPKKEPRRLKGLSSELRSEEKEKQAVPAAPELLFDYLGVSPQMESIVPEADELKFNEYNVQRRERVIEAPSSTTETVPVAIYYLQAGTFRDKARADALKTKLAGLGFECEIQEEGSSDTGVIYVVRVGPFADRAALDKSRRKLNEMGVKARTVRYRD